MMEAQTVEWKRVWRDEYLKWISGFANAFFRIGYIEDGGLWVKFPLPDVYRSDRIRAGTTQKTVQKTTQKTTQKILAILLENPFASRREIAERLTDITASGVKYHLDRLKAEGIVRRVGPDKGGHWEVLQ